MRAAFAAIALSIGTVAVGQTSPVKPTLAKPIPPPKPVPPSAAPPFAPGATTYVYVATVQSGSPRRLGSVTVGINWACDKSGCKTIAAWPRPLVTSCNLLAQQIGPIASFGRSGLMLSAAELDACNKGVAGAAMVAVKPTPTIGKTQTTKVPSDTGSDGKTGSAPATPSSLAATTKPPTDTGAVEDKKDMPRDSQTAETNTAEGGAAGSTTGAPAPATESSQPRPAAEAAASPGTNSSPSQPTAEAAAAPATEPDVAGTSAQSTGPATAGSIVQTADSAPATVSSDPPASSAAPSGGVAVGTPGGVVVRVAELALVGGAQGAPTSTAAGLTVATPELSISGGVQGSAPVRLPPIVISVRELSLVGQ